MLSEKRIIEILDECFFWFCKDEAAEDITVLIKQAIKEERLAIIEWVEGGCGKDSDSSNPVTNYYFDLIAGELRKLD